MDKEHLRREGIRVLPPVYPLGALLVAWLLESVAPLANVPWWLRALGWALAIAAAGVFAWAISEQVRNKTDPSPWAATKRLVDSGPYAWSRNPICLADLLMQAGVSLGAGWLWGLALLPVTGACLRFFVVAKEERFLALTFGPAYAAYCKRTSRWLGKPGR